MIKDQVDSVPETNDSKNNAVAPRDQLLYNVIINVLALFGIGDLDFWGIPYKNFLKRFYKIHGYVNYTAPLCFISQMAYVYLNYSELTFYTLGVIFSVVPITVNICVKILSTKLDTYKKVMTEFMDKIHIYNKHLEEPNNLHITMIVNQTEKLTRFAGYFLSGCLLTDWTAWAVLPYMHYLANKEKVARKEVKLETCVHLYAPFDYSYNVKNWYIMHFVGTYFNFGGITVVVTFDTLSFIFIFNLIGHLRILRHKMETIFKREKMTDLDVSRGLVEIIEYHAYINKSFDDIQNAFGLNITANYMQNLFVDSLLLYQLMVGVNEDNNHVIVFGLMFLAYMGGLAFMSLVLEEIRRQSETFSDLVYDFPWEDMTKRNQITTLLILKKMQQTLVFKGAGGLNTGVTPMISIIKSTFSYYVMLSNRNTD